MATDAQIEYIEQLQEFAYQRVENARLSWGEDLLDMPVSEARILISDLVNIRDNKISNQRYFKDCQFEIKEDRDRIFKAISNSFNLDKQQSKLIWDCIWKGETN